MPLKLQEADFCVPYSHCHSPSPTFLPSCPPPPDDDVDLEQLVNDMNSSMESVYSTQADTALLLNNSHAHHPHNPAYPGHGRRHTPPLAASSPARGGLRHSQPMHIQAVR